MECTACSLHVIRKKMVIPFGPIPADMLFIVDSPNKVEDLFGIWLIGKDRETFNSLFCRKGLNEVSVFVMNTIPCRAASHLGVLPEEFIGCSMKDSIIDKIQPKVVVLSGSTAQRYYKKVFPNAIKIIDIHLLTKMGGAKSSQYLRTINILKSAVETINKEKP